MHKNLSIAKRDNDRYSVAFETLEGRLTCEISVARQKGASDRRTPREKEMEARKKLKRLAEEFSSSISVRARKGLMLCVEQDQPRSCALRSVHPIMFAPVRTLS
jgi:hypothetical protein